MLNPTALTLAEIKEFVQTPQTIKFKSQSRNERNQWIEQILRQHRYRQCLKPDKTVIRKYILLMTGLSRQQLTRLIAEYSQRGTLAPKEYHRHKFPKVYDLEEIALLAETDKAHNCLSGPATKKINHYTWAYAHGLY